MCFVLLFFSEIDLELLRLFKATYTSLCKSIVEHYAQSETRQRKLIHAFSLLFMEPNLQYFDIDYHVRLLLIYSCLSMLITK